MTNQPDLAELLRRLVGAPVSGVFGALLVAHIVAGMTCVTTGAIASLSRKARGRHPSFGEVYYWSLAVVFVTATGMAAMRWSESAYLFVLGTIGFSAGSVAYAARKLRWPGWFTVHAIGMSVSYIVLMTAFYVDNGPRLPLWQQLPTVAFWIAPTIIGLPLLIRALRRRNRFANDVRAAADAKNNRDERAACGDCIFEEREPDFVGAQCSRGDARSHDRDKQQCRPHELGQRPMQQAPAWSLRLPRTHRSNRGAVTSTGNRRHRQRR
jgi:hypothetical protein